MAIGGCGGEMKRRERARDARRIARRTHHVLDLLLVEILAEVAHHSPQVGLLHLEVLELLRLDRLIDRAIAPAARTTTVASRTTVASLSGDDSGDVAPSEHDTASCGRSTQHSFRTPLLVRSLDTRLVWFASRRCAARR